jgi:histidinol-phosphatase (PHP family)
MEEYVRRAVELGMTHFGVSDHGPAYWKPYDHAYPGIQMALSWLPEYVREAEEVRARFDSRIVVSVGLEADFIEGQESELRALLDAHPFDYVLGSVHYCRGRSIFDKTRWQTENPYETYTAYYELLIQAAQSGMFDVLSHLTAIESYGPPIKPILSDKLYPRVADAIAASGCVVEINTSGYRKMPHADEPFPNRTLLALLIARGVPLTFGSDCHDPMQVAFGQERVLALLESLGATVSNNVQPITKLRSPIQAFCFTK